MCRHQLRPTKLQQWQGLGGEFVCLSTLGRASKIAGDWLVEGRDLPKSEVALVLRPDRLILASSKAIRLEAVVQKAIGLLS